MTISRISRLLSRRASTAPDHEVALEGFVDFASNTEIRGWVYDAERPNDPLTVHIVAGDVVIAALVANGFREDLLRTEKGNGKHAFHFTLESGSTSALLVATVEDWLIPLSSLPPWPRYLGKFMHPMGRGFPAVECGFTEAAESVVELQIVARLIDAYHRAVADISDHSKAKADVWSVITGSQHIEITTLLQQRNVAGVADYLRQAHTKGITEGVTQGETTTQLLRARGDLRQRVVSPFVDYLVSLAEFLGLRDLECPEQGPWGESLYVDVDTLIERIRTTLGIELVPPAAASGLFGIRSRQGILSGRDLLALYAALRIQQLASTSSSFRAAVCEIGAGLGGVAYYAVQLGLGPYTIIDLPIMNVLQGYYLLRTLPNIEVRLYGEQAKPAAVTVLPTFCFAQMPLRYDFLLNQDSLPEMHRDFALDYLRIAPQHLGNAFLSINQEARSKQAPGATQNVVRELARETGQFKLTHRSRHWLRAGYVEEIYVPSS